MLQIVKSILSSTDENKYNIVTEILETVENDLAPNELSVFQFLKQGYDDLRQFQTEEIFINRFPEFKLTLKDTEPLDDQSLDYHKREFILKHKKNAISRKMLSMVKDIQQTGLTSDMVESLRNDITVEEDDTTILTSPSAVSLYEESKNVGSRGLKTYITELDQIIGTIDPGTITVIAGYTGHGKTTWAANMAYKGARDGRHVVYISLEVAERDLIYQLISLHSTDMSLGVEPIPHQAIRTRKLTASQEEAFKKVDADFREKVLPNLHILTESNFKDFSYGEVRDILYRIDAEKPIDAVFVDHANLLKYYVKSRYNSVTEGGNEFVSFFRKLAICFKKDKDGKDRQIAVFLLAQCNRTGWSKALAAGKKNPNLEGKYDNTALAEINELERAASRIFFTYASPNMKLGKQAVVCFTKNRFGQTLEDPIAIDFNPEFYQFGESWGQSGTSSYDYSSVQYDDFIGLDPNAIGFSSLGVDISDL